MNTAALLELGLDTLIFAAKLAAPMLLTALAVGFAVSLFQSITQIQEVTLSFVPKAIAVALVMVVTGHWMIAESIAYTNAAMARIPTLLGAG
jgi:flagellar biosynthesis protein FliQ